MTLRLVSILSMALLLVLPAQLDAFITQNTGELRYGNMRENYGKTKRLPASGKSLNLHDPVVMLSEGLSLDYLIISIKS